MSTMVYIGKLLWTILLMCSFKENGALDISDESVTTTNNPATKTTTTTMTPLNITHNTLVLCQCGPGYAMNDTGQCQIWVNGTTVPMTPSPGKEMQHVDTTELDVTVREPQCEYHQVDLQEDQFILRPRGDLVVTKGDLRGLRVADYCVHYQQSEGQLNVTAQGCVSVPDIPRCCPQGLHMINGECASATASNPFNPPLAVGPHGEEYLAGASFPWPERKEHFNIPSCETGYVMKKIELDGQKAYLMALPQGVYLTWIQESDERQHSKTPEYCVDASGDNGTYYANTCHKELDIYCKNKLCTQKCCQKGQALSTIARGCVPSDLPFEPLFPIPPSSMSIIHDYPDCTDIIDINLNNSELLKDGTLKYGGDIYPFKKFCTDNFVREGSVSPGALACITEIQKTLWHDVREVLYPVCHGISCIFVLLLFLLVACIPKLRKEDGRYQLFHAASLLVAFSVSLTLNLLSPLGYLGDGACITLAFVMQFAFLSAFFWLNMMCFDVFRLFRNLVKNMSTPSSVATWKYMLYGLGGPLTITMITILIQFVAPNDGSIPGLMHPGIGEGRCWFKSNKELWLFFYGPITVLFLLNFIFLGMTYYYVRIVRGDYKSAKDPCGYTIASAETAIKYDFYTTHMITYCSLIGQYLAMTSLVTCKLRSVDGLMAVTDIINGLQGVLLFIVFFYPKHKRALLMEKLSNAFQIRNDENDKEAIIDKSK
ncbi:unnamed protein product [Meganyctiphanes norvegica]|uniref:G-protein coupled receptors family 2 profile 2 domain-containing protein n=1 Tax=Meganyctiphanes norvegica TaxID=48144 RepID=A0AAV2PKT7_MEGNR